MAAGGLVRSESMEVSNDPRFFASNVIDKRLAAVSGLSVVSTLMVNSALSECYSMKKDLDVSQTNGVLEFISFFLMNLVLFANVLATWVGVAQVYFTYRLMTAGATGFEMAAGFYLNPNVAFWRHLAVKWMLQSLPLFLAAGGVRMLVKFDADMPDVEGSVKDAGLTSLPWWDARVGGLSALGLLVGAEWLLIGLALFYINSKHSSVFKERYAMAKTVGRPLSFQSGSMSARGIAPDV